MPTRPCHACISTGTRIVATLAEAPDPVLMDIQMPVLEGLAALRRLRTVGYRAPVVASTANVLPQSRERYRRAGFDVWLAKPVECEAFVSGWQA